MKFNAHSWNRISHEESTSFYFSKFWLQIVSLLKFISLVSGLRINSVKKKDSKVEKWGNYCDEQIYNIPRQGITNYYYVYSIIRLYRTRLYRNSVYIELQSAVSPDTMFINTKDGYIETRIYQSIYHGPLNFDITGLYCNWYEQKNVSVQS